MMGGALVAPLAVDSPPPQPARATAAIAMSKTCLPQICISILSKTLHDFRGVSAAETVGIGGRTLRKNLAVFSTGNPAICRCTPQTGSFASPPRGGFALAL